MNDIKATNRSPFFVKDKNSIITDKSMAESSIRAKNSKKRQLEVKNNTENDAKVEIPKKIKDFSRIKKAVDHAPEVDNRDKIEALKKRIESGDYDVRINKIAEKILSREF